MSNGLNSFVVTIVFPIIGMTYIALLPGVALTLLSTQRRGGQCARRGGAGSCISRTVADGTPVLCRRLQPRVLFFYASLFAAYTPDSRTGSSKERDAPCFAAEPQASFPSLQLPRRPLTCAPKAFLLLSQLTTQ